MASECRADNLSLVEKPVTGPSDHFLDKDDVRLTNADWQSKLQNEIETRFNVKGRDLFRSPHRFVVTLKFRVSRDKSISNVEIIPLNLKYYRSVGRGLLLKILKNLEGTEALVYPDSSPTNFIDVEMQIDKTYRLIAK